MFWVYGFPILMVVGLGIAFRNQPVEKITVDVQDGPRAEAIVQALAATRSSSSGSYSPERSSAATCAPARPTWSSSPANDGQPTTTISFDPSRPPSLLARNAVDDALRARRRAQRRGRSHRCTSSTSRADATSIFSCPGLLGMSLMGGGLWGVGFVTVDMRIRKLLKRFLATPMRKTDFLAGVMISRLLFMVPEVFVLLLFARLAFGVRHLRQPVWRAGL